MRVGVIGLGAGTMACWGRTNDTYRFFEINPKVVDIASNTNYFTYLADSKATVSIGLGDARALLTAETNRYDVLVIDAYSGDVIPLHLATKEAFQLYLDRLKPGGGKKCISALVH
jgi:spermidine synthase